MRSETRQLDKAPSFQGLRMAHGVAEFCTYLSQTLFTRRTAIPAHPRLRWINATYRSVIPPLRTFTRRCTVHTKHAPPYVGADDNSKVGKGLFSSSPPLLIIIIISLSFRGSAEYYRCRFPPPLLQSPWGLQASGLRMERERHILYTWDKRHSFVFALKNPNIDASMVRPV